jgi:SAM-dependent methyltransferase
LSSRYRFRDPELVVHASAAADVAAAYNQAGGDYVAYAHGDPTHLFQFDGLHAYADRRVLTLLDTKLTDLRASGTRTIRILDAGCGPGTWLRRLVTRVHALGFTTITARGFDVAGAQIQRARLLARDLCGIPGVTFTFDVADLTAELPEADASVDLTLCLYSVLSHLPVGSLPKISAEAARVTLGHFIATLRSVGSTPTISVDSIEKARHFKHDSSRDRCEIELCDGRHMKLSFHLFTASELRSCFLDHFDIEDLRGLDLFHNRFAPDLRWNPATLVVGNQFSNELERLEETYATSSGFIERATHLLLVACRRQTVFPSSWRQKADAARDQRDANDHGDNPGIGEVAAV